VAGTPSATQSSSCAPHSPALAVVGNNTPASGVSKFRSAPKQKPKPKPAATPRATSIASATGPTPTQQARPTQQAAGAAAPNQSRRNNSEDSVDEEDVDVPDADDDEVDTGDGDREVPSVSGGMYSKLKAHQQILKQRFSDKHIHNLDEQNKRERERKEYKAGKVWDTPNLPQTNVTSATNHDEPFYCHRFFTWIPHELWPGLLRCPKCKGSDIHRCVPDRAHVSSAYPP
jgi:hypothetical protein